MGLLLITPSWVFNCQPASAYVHTVGLFIPVVSFTHTHTRTHTHTHTHTHTQRLCSLFINGRVPLPVLRGAGAGAHSPDISPRSALLHWTLSCTCSPIGGPCVGVARTVPPHRLALLGRPAGSMSYEAHQNKVDPVIDSEGRCVLSTLCLQHGHMLSSFLMYL